MQLGALQLPSGRRATTIPEPALPLNTKPALRMVKTARPLCQLNHLVLSLVRRPTSTLTLAAEEDLLGDRVER